VLTKSQRFRNMTVATVVAVMIFIVAVAGILALVTMSFPADSLLYPRSKND
jgi:branched-subunit amino acid permease